MLRSVGDNAGVMVALKVILHACRPNQPPSCLVVADSEETAHILSVYHLGEQACSRFGEKDTIIVMDPLVKDVRFPHDGHVSKRGCVFVKPDTAFAAVNAVQEVSYKTIQVFQPEKFIVNGRVLPPSRESSLAITVFDQ